MESPAIFPPHWKIHIEFPARIQNKKKTKRANIEFPARTLNNKKTKRTNRGMGAFPPVDCLNVLRVEDMDNDLLSDHLLREPFFKNSLADFFRQMFSGKKNSQRAPRGTPQFCHFFYPISRYFWVQKNYF